MPADKRRVTIVHPDGREYSIEPKAFTDPKLSPEKKSYAERGFQIVSYVDGSPYDGPKSQREIEAATAERQAKRDERAAEKSAVKPAAKPKGD